MAHTTGLIYKLANFAETTLAQALDIAGLSAVVASSTKFPALSSNEAFRVTLHDGTQDPEIIEISAVSAETWTITRGLEGTTAVTWASGTLVRLAPTAEVLQHIAQIAESGIQVFPRDIADDVTLVSGFGAFGIGSRFAGDVTIETDAILVISPETTITGTLTVEAGGTLVTMDGVEATGVVTFTSLDATPDVSGGRVFKTANAGATTITDFDLGKEGKTIQVIIGDANTTFDFTASSLRGNAGVDWVPGVDDHMTCVQDDAGVWFCDISDNTV